MHWKIAAAQIEVTGDIEKNLSTILANITEAAQQQANIICFPEICLIDDDMNARRISRESRAIQAAAALHGIHVICGSYVIDDTKRIRNQIWVIDRTGNIVMRYNKRNLYKAESAAILPGKRNKIFELDGIRFAIINCWDYAFPEEIRSLAAKGAEVIFCPSYLLSHPRTKDVLDKIPQVRAFDAMTYFVMVDAFAQDTYKRSKICHPLRVLSAISLSALVLSEYSSRCIHGAVPGGSGLRSDSWPVRAGGYIAGLGAGVEEYRAANGSCARGLHPVDEPLGSCNYVTPGAPRFHPGPLDSPAQTRTSCVCRSDSVCQSLLVRSRSLDAVHRPRFR